MSDNNVGRGNTNSFFEVPDRVTLSDIFEVQPVVEFMFGGSVNYNATINNPLLRGGEEGEGILFGGKILPLKGVPFVDIAPHVVNNAMFVIVPRSTFTQYNMLEGERLNLSYPCKLIDLTEEEIGEAINVGAPIITSDIINLNYWTKGISFPYNYYLICNMGNGEYKLIVPLNKYPATMNFDGEIKRVHFRRSKKPAEVMIRDISMSLRPPIEDPKKHYVVELKVKEACGWLASPEMFYFDNWLAKELFLLLINKHKVYCIHGETAVGVGLNDLLYKPDQVSESTPLVVELLNKFDPEGDRGKALGILLEDVMFAG